MFIKKFYLLDELIKGLLIFDLFICLLVLLLLFENIYFDQINRYSGFGPAF